MAIASITSAVVAAINSDCRDADLISDMQDRLTELNNELAALRQIPSPTSSTALLAQYEELLSEIQATLNGNDGTGKPGLLDIMKAMESSKDPDVVALVHNTKGTFSKVFSDLNTSKIGDTAFGAAAADQTTLAKYLATVINQNGENFLNTMIGDINKLNPQ
jgi:hypothetical protein